MRPPLQLAPLGWGASRCLLPVSSGLIQWFLFWFFVTHPPKSVVHSLVLHSCRVTSDATCWVTAGSPYATWIFDVPCLIVVVSILASLVYAVYRLQVGSEVRSSSALRVLL